MTMPAIMIHEGVVTEIYACGCVIESGEKVKCCCCNRWSERECSLREDDDTWNSITEDTDRGG